MNLSEITEKLKTDYIAIIKKFETTVDIGQMSLSLPKIAAPFQFHYYDLLKEYSKLSDELDELYHAKVFNVKIGNDTLSVVDFNSSELKKMVETSPEYRKLQMRLNEIKNDLKIIEEMMSTIKNFGFNINNSIKFKEMMGA